ncbi:MAG TPA: hypothetical protein DE315_08630 [Candidatus Omnitrophica bacterium]|nr:MAG: hypothetical protein A2Y05_04950 [Omnitrophica WOR_2 bacterium GWA2_53_43]HBO96757.1 hypothetical protein [Candidatus Omnitrophota bacterium]HCI45574.1 hypothetical protein [Candidatus Omnitrophota bacterium]
MHSDKILGALLKFCLVILFLKFVVFGAWMKSPTHKGPGYSILKPVGWEVIEDATGVQPIFAATDKPNVVLFARPEKIPPAGSLSADTSVPEATIAVLVVKLANPTWMEDEFPTLLDALGKAGYHVFDHGQIKVDNEIFEWVLYKDPTGSLVNLEFYYVNELNKLFKIQYQASLDAFKTYRPVFESTKDTFKFSQQLW